MKTCDICAEDVSEGWILEKKNCFCCRSCWKKLMAINKGVNAVDTKLFGWKSFGKGQDL